MKIQSAHTRGERAVLTSHSAGTASALRPIASIGAAMILSVATLTPAYAGNAIDLGCVGNFMQSFNCAGQWSAAGDPYVRAVPDVVGDEQQARAAARDRQWMVRCNPVVEHDRYGVARYHYSAPGCEFGLSAE